MKYLIKGYKNLEGERYYVPMVKVFGIYWSFIKPISVISNEEKIIRISAWPIMELFSESLKFYTVEEAYECVKAFEKENRIRKILESKKKEINVITLTDFYYWLIKRPFMKITYDSEDIKCD